MSRTWFSYALAKSLYAGSIAALLSTTGLGQIPIPPHASIYNGFSRGFNFTANTDFFINQLDLPLDAQQAGDTASYLVRVNSVEVLRSVGNAGAISTNIQISTGDIVDIIGNWSPAATNNFSAHNSYGSGAPYATTIEGVAHTLNRTGWQWDIGDASYLSGAYLAAGSGSIGRVLVYTNPPSGLFAGFAADVQSGPTPLTVNFTDQSFSSDPGGILSWSWDVNGDGNPDYTTQNCTHTYTTEGLYDVSLTVTDLMHGSNTKTEMAYIAVDVVSASFIFNPAGGNSVNFVDTSAGNPTSWAWDFENDGTIDSTLQNPSHTYPAPGVYTCALTVMDAISMDSTTVGVGVSVLDVGPFQSTFSSATLTRGFYFQAPVKFSFTSLQVPDESGHGLQNVAVYNLGQAPPAYSATIPGTPVFFAAGVPSNQQIPVNISFDAGDWVGLLGACGDASTMRSSYGAAGGYPSSLFGMPVTLNRMLTQTNIVSNSGVCAISSENAGSIGRVLCGISAATGISYGTGSTTTVGANAPVMFTSALPILGQTGELTVDLDPAESGSLVYYALGLGRQNIPLPPFTVYTLPVVTLGPFNGTAGATNVLSLPLPPIPVYAGALGTFQNVNLTPQGNLSMSNGVEWCLNF